MEGGFADVSVRKAAISIHNLRATYGASSMVLYRMSRSSVLVLMRLGVSKQTIGHVGLQQVSPLKPFAFAFPFGSSRCAKQRSLGGG